MSKTGDGLRILTYYIAELPLRDQRETMERPFFSLSKRKRMNPIDYRSPDGKIWIKISPHQDHGMATIWDADILIWATSQLLEAQRQGKPISRMIAFRAFDLLRAIGRADKRTCKVPGSRYDELKAALERLQSTVIRTNIRTLRGNRERTVEAMFNWIDRWRSTRDDDEPPMMELELSDWVYEGVLDQGGALAIDPAYFNIEGGLERALYRIARKHVGQQERFKIGLDKLYDKTGSDSTMKEFRRMLRGITQLDRLPGYHVFCDADNMVTFVKRHAQDCGG
jgi:plasmid replication initiation protein